MIQRNSKIQGEELLQGEQKNWNSKITWTNFSETGNSIFMRCFKKNGKTQDNVNSSSFILLLFVKHKNEWKHLSVFDVDSCKGHIKKYVSCIDSEVESTRHIQVEYKEKNKKECLLFTLPESINKKIEVTVEDTDDKCKARKSKWFIVTVSQYYIIADY